MPFYYSWEAVLSHVAQLLSEEAGVKIKPEDLVSPPKPDYGDISYGCFELAKKKGKNPAEIAKEIAAKLGKDDHTIESVTAAGPYVNVAFKPGELIDRIVQDVEHHGDAFGASEDGKGKALMLEYAQPNTHKEIHVGHLRNLVLGASIAKLLEMNGWKVVTASYHGDVGAHVAKGLWLLVREASSVVPQPKPKKPKKGETAPPPLAPDAWAEHVIRHLDVGMADTVLASIPKGERMGSTLGRYYAEATKLLEENPQWKEEVSHVQRELEAGSPGWAKVWQETRRWSVAEFSEVFQDLGVTIRRQYFESEVVDEGQRIVDELLKKGIARESQGAIIVDLEDRKLGVFLVRKSDGTSLYATKDLALAKLKLREYPSLDRSLLLVDNRQSLYFRQLFATLELMGMKVASEFIGYEFVTLASGAMSSREGNVVTWNGFRKEVVDFTTRETKERHADWPPGRIQHTAWALAMGGIKYGMLKQDSDKVFVFDLRRALSFDGDTGLYVQYAVTRLGAILKKAGWDPEGESGDPSLLVEPMEKRLALQIAAFPAACRKAALELRPAVVAQWCLATAQRITDFYRDVNVLEAPFGTKQARLRLIAATRAVLIKGLDLLCIPVPDEM